MGTFNLTLWPALMNNVQENPTALTVIKRKNCRRVLIICPSAIYQWLNMAGLSLCYLKRARFDQKLPDV